jgi:hypothetical protein
VVTFGVTSISPAFPKLASEATRADDDVKPSPRELAGGFQPDASIASRDQNRFHWSE